MTKINLLSSNINFIIFTQISVKYKDISCPTIFIVISDQTIHQGLLDFEAGINFVPFTMYGKLGLFMEYGDYGRTSPHLGDHHVHA